MPILIFLTLSFCLFCIIRCLLSAVLVNLMDAFHRRRLHHTLKSSLVGSQRGGPPMYCNHHLRPIRTTRTYGPYVRAVCTARTYGCIFDTRTHGPYLRPVFTGAFLTPVFTARIYGCQKYTHMYGPYIRAVFTGSAYRPLPASSVAEDSQCRRNERKGLSVRGPGRSGGSDATECLDWK